MDLHQNVGLIDNTDRPSGLIDYRKLGNIRAAHAFECSEESVAGSNRNDFAGLIAVRNQITYISVGRPGDKALLSHPKIIVHFREVFVAGVRNQTYHSLRLPLFPAITQRARKQSSGRRTPKNSFFAQKLPGDGKT